MFPEEVEVWYIFPALRREISIELRALGLKNTEIAERLSLTKAAVSQYISGKRAAGFEFDDKFKVKIKKGAKEIKDGGHVVAVIKKLTKELWKTDFVCELHKKFADLPKECDWCENVKN